MSCSKTKNKINYTTALKCSSYFYCLNFHVFQNSIFFTPNVQVNNYKAGTVEGVGGEKEGGKWGSRETGEQGKWGSRGRKKVGRCSTT